MKKITDEELKKASDAAYADVRTATDAAACAANAATYATDAAACAANAATYAAYAAAYADVDINIGTKQIEMVRKVFIDMEEIK